MTSLCLRPLRVGDEAPFLAAHDALAAEDFVFGLGFQPGTPWPRYLAELEASRVGVGVPDHLVPATFLVADVGGVIVGRASVRHRLNEFLAREGGHIGYAVLAEHRRRGHATEILRQSLIIARANGVERVLVTCDDDNVGSATVIERCGGVLDGIVESTRSATTMRRYWID